MSRKRKAGQDLALLSQPSLSAFAAAKAGRNILPTNTDQETSSSPTQKVNLETVASSETWTEPGLDYDSEAGISQEDEDEDESEGQNDDQDPTLDVRLSTWTPSNAAQSIKSEANIHHSEGCQRIELTYGQTLAVLGQYNLEVVSGVVTVYGAFLTQKSGSTRIIAPSTHPLPVLRCVSSDGAELLVLSIKHEDESSKCLERVSPLFSGIWHCECGKYALDEIGYTFTKIQRSTDHDLKRSVTGLDTPYHWQQALSTLYDRTSSGLPIIQICGPFGSGKSTFSRMLVNSLLRASSQSKTESRLVAVLDLDLDRPEFSIPGHISLTVLSKSMLEPSFAYRMGNSELVRAHAVGLNGFKGDAEHYLDSVRDLVAHFRNMVQEQRGGQSRIVSLVVHCPAWYQGSGNDLTSKLVSTLESTDIVCLAELPAALEACFQMLASRPQVFQLAPKLEQRLHSARTPVQLREMRLITYFHDDFLHRQRYKSTPISSWRPYKVSYDLKHRHFAGFFIFGEAPAMYPNALSTLLNGSIVSIVVVEDDAVFMGRDVEEGVGDGIPFFVATSQGYSKPFDPGRSHSIGLALIRSIDLEKKELLLLTPAKVGEMERDRTVLAFGALETPGWAYLEDHHFRDSTAGPEHLLLDTSSEWPWVERTRASDDGADARLGMQAWKTRRFKAPK